MVNIILIGIIDLKMSSTSLISKVSKDIKLMWYCVGGRAKQENLLSNQLIIAKVKLPP